MGSYTAPKKNTSAFSLTYMCSVPMRNLAGYVTGHPLCNRPSGSVTGRPDALPVCNANRLRNRSARCVTNVFKATLIYIYMFSTVAIEDNDINTDQFIMHINQEHEKQYHSSSLDGSICVSEHFKWYHF